LGQSTGTVTLSNGQSYSVTTNVLAPGVVVSTVNVSAGGIPVGSRSDINPITITNDRSSALSLSQEQITGPFSATNKCPASLAAGASCSINVYFSPQATGAAGGQLHVPTGAGSIVVALDGTGVVNPADVKFSPASLLFVLGASGNSVARTITITNDSATNSVQVGALTNLAACFGTNNQTDCLHVLSNNCSVLVPLASCLIDIVYQGLPGAGPLPYHFFVPLTASGSGEVDYAFQYTQVQPSPTAALSVTPSSLQFPPTPFGHATVPQSVTVKNISATTVTVISYPAQDFITEPSCGPLVPGATCAFSVSYFPTSGNMQSNRSLTDGTITFSPVDFAYPDQFHLVGSGGGIVVSGSTISPAALASPAYPPLIQPVDVSSKGLIVTNASSTPLVLSSFSSGLLIDASNCAAPLATGQSCTLIPRGPDCAPDPGCGLSVYSNAASSPDTYMVTGQQAGSLFLDAFSIPDAPFVFAPTVIGTTATAAFHISISGYSSDPISFVVNSNLDKSFAISNDCPSTFASGYIAQICQIALTFTPPSAGLFTGTLTSTTNILGKTTAPIAGFGVPAPGLSISPASLLLAAAVGQTDTKTVTLKNTSIRALSLAAPALAGPQAASFAIAGSTCGSSLAAEGSCTIDVIYTKPDYESLATLIITSGNNVIQTVALTGLVPELLVGSNGGGGPPSAYVGTSTDAVYTLSTFLGAPITIESIALTGADAGSFKVASSTCPPNLTLSGTATCVIDVAFTPKTPGIFHAMLTIASTAAPYPLDLGSVGIAGPAKVSPTAVAFGNEVLGATSATQRITISNPNPSDVTLPALPPVSGANASDFKVGGACTAIAAHASCQLMVSFAPSAAGARTAALVIGTGTTTDPNTGGTIVNSVTIQFTGTGVASIPGARVHPRHLDFGKEEVGRSTHHERVSLINPGLLALTLPGAPSVGGQDGKDFRVRGDCKTIAPHGHCELSVVFDPTATGHRSAVLSIPTGGSKATIDTVDLSGLGCRIEERDDRRDDGELRDWRDDRFEREHRDRVRIDCGVQR
jgi:Abnormal spindle-like microcephaly-assoc'd, ASPM-SPD-2-Hydin